MRAKKKLQQRGNKKICLECSKYINLKRDHHVQVHTLNRSISPDDHEYFHFQCWVNYFNRCVERKMKENVSMMQEQAMSLFNSPVIKEALSKISGSGIALNMLKLPLKADPVLKQVIKKRIKNGRNKKRSKKRRKA